MELYHVNQWADQAQREKSWLFGELDMRNMIVQGDRAKQKKDNNLRELRRICCEESG